MKRSQSLKKTPRNKSKSKSHSSEEEKTPSNKNAKIKNRVLINQKSISIINK